MAPKPALYESSKGMDNEHNLLSDEAHYAGKEMHNADFHDDASEAGENSVVSYSDYSNCTTDNEAEDESTSRRDRRSRRHRSSSRRRKSSRSRGSRDNMSKSSDRDRRQREKEEVERPEEPAPEEPQDEDEEESVSPRKSSHVFQTEGQEAPGVVIMKNGKASDQPYIKLLNFNTLHREEQDRAPRYAEELEKITSNWNTCKTVLQRLLDEVKHANHLFHVSDVSFHQYSHVMYTIHKDIFLDDQGQRVLSSARQQLLLKQRGSNNVDGNGRDEPSTTAGDGYLDPLYNSFSVLTDTMMKTVLDRESDNGKQAATIEFQEFCEELICQAEAMKALGDSVVQEMEGSEMDIQNSFQVLQHLAAKVKTSKSSSVLDEDIKLGKPNKNFPKEMAYGGSNASAGDWWLWETLYRAAVKHQQVSWDGNQERMEGLEESLKYFQEKHQKKLEKAVLAVMPEQREMFLLGAKSFESALQKTDAFASEIEGKARFDHEQMANEFERGVQKRSASLMQKKTHHKSSILNRSRSKYNSAIEQAESMSASSSGDLAVKPLPAFGSPILSKLVLEAKVLERWDKSGWLTTVAVFTVDRFLHLFDCSDLDTKTLPQTAFTSMFPTSASTRTNVHHRGGGRKKANRVTESKIPNPTMTFNLVTCTLKTYGYARRSFEIKQVADPTKKSKDMPHTTLRFKDNPEAAQWYGLLQDLPEYNQGRASQEQVKDDNQEQHDYRYDEEEVEAEASRQKHLYDDIDADLIERDEEGSEEDEDLQDLSDGEDVPENAEGYAAADDEEDGFEDAFEDASEYLGDDGKAVGNSKEGAEAAADEKYIYDSDGDEADMEEVKVETVNDNDDDSFHST